MTNAPRRRTAFSLIELIVVLVIMATVSAIALPRYAQSLDRYRVDMAGQRIVADIARAQSEAKSTSSSVTIIFSPTNETYSIPEIPSPQDPGAAFLVNLGAEPYAVDITGGVFDTDAIIVFDGYGAPDSGGTVSITRGGVTRVVEVDADTGKAAIQ